MRAIDSSTSGHCAWLGKGYYHLARRAVKANIVAVLTTVVWVGGVRHASNFAALAIEGMVMGMQFLRRAAMLAFAVCLPTHGIHAQELCEVPAGRFASIEGSVDVQSGEAQGWRAARLDQRLCEGDTVRVGERSRAAVYLINEAVLRIDQNTTLRLLNISEKKEERSLLDLLKGAFLSLSRQPRTLKVNTPYVNALIEGTEFVVQVEDERAWITVFEGRVLASNDRGSQRVAPGQSVAAEAGKAPELRTVVRPRDAVQWSLYYPPVLAVLGGRVERVPADVPPSLRKAIELAGRGDTTAAFRALDRVVQADRSTRFYLYRAALLLSVGQVVEARADIDKTLKQDPKAGLAYALRAVIEVVQNERKQALADAERAVALSPTAAAKIALSYAQQADFQIETARDTLRSAVEQHPDDPLAWARLGELWLMLGDRRQALAAAKKAASLVPDLARTQLVLGFAALAEFRNRDAKAAFERAITLSPADPLAHLGLGLAKISAGKLAQGRRDLEVAVGLDANSALLRAYLGKAYFEEKRYPLDAEQYGIAKSLDPADPTAYLYDGILKQTVNRPVEALRDLQTSIELNDNRAVYRSRLLLDEDRAARETSVGRIYNDLGFHQLGINEASRSLALDPANYSAHRFLSDTYLGVRRREIARVSELLQAQLLQDINIYPIQPSLSETNLNILTRGGPADPGVNEFTPLFQRNQVQLNATGLAGDEDTFGGEGVISAVYDQLSLSGGVFHLSTDGWRPNHDIKHDIYDVYAQAAITPDLNVQFELRRRESDVGAIEFNFDPDDFSPDATRSLDQDIGRAGLRYSPTPNSDVLLSFIYSDREESVVDTIDLFSSDSGVDDEGYQIEGQYLYRRDWFNLTAGFASSDVDRDDDFSVALAGEPPFFEESSQQEITQTRGYVYGNLNLPAAVTWTLGVSYDDFNHDLEQFDLEDLDVEKVNPKFGVQWHVTKGLLLRGAVFRTVKPALITNRTIEPTQIAGFNQFFDDTNATAAWRYGVASDWRPTRTLFAGAEATWRDLEVPVLDVEGFVSEDQDEQLHRVYVFWTPHPEWALSAEFVYDRFESERGILTDLGPVPAELETFSVPVGIRFFHPTGFFAGLGVTYVHQDVERAPDSTFAGGTDDFVPVDIAVGYRLPKRLGILSLQVTNLFDEEFRFQDDSFRELGDDLLTGPYFPDRQIIGRITLSF